MICFTADLQRMAPNVTGQDNYRQRRLNKNHYCNSSNMKGVQVTAPPRYGTLRLMLAFAHRELYRTLRHRKARRESTEAANALAAM
jgi:hypothetical protein